MEFVKLIGAGVIAGSLVVGGIRALEGPKDTLSTRAGAPAAPLRFDGLVLQSVRFETPSPQNTTAYANFKGMIKKLDLAHHPSRDSATYCMHPAALDFDCSIGVWAECNGQRSPEQRVYSLERFLYLEEPGKKQ